MTHDIALPSEWVTRWAHLVRPGGRVLDLACGAGRHARYFAARGHPVTACDRDGAALAGLAGIPDITVREADLENGSAWPFEPAAFEAVVVCNYLHRPLFAQIGASLATGGVLLYETFLAGNERYGKPSNPRFLLERDELFAAFAPSLVVVGFEQGLVETVKPALIQRLCAVRSENNENKLEP